MNLMTVFFLQAPAAGPAGGGSMMWIMLIAMFVIMYFFMIRPQNKKQKEIANFRKSLQVNQKVITAGGFRQSRKRSWATFLLMEIRFWFSAAPMLMFPCHLIRTSTG